MHFFYLIVSFSSETNFKNTTNSFQNKLIKPNHAYSCLGFGKLFNVLQSPIGRMASWQMRNIETFPSNHMYLY